MFESGRRLPFLSVLAFAPFLLMNGCREAPIQNIAANSDQRVDVLVEELMEIVRKSEPYRLTKQEQVNKVIVQLVPFMRTNFGKQLGRELSEAEQARLTNIARETLDVTIDETILDEMKQYFLRHFESDELEDIYKFRKTTAAKKLQRMTLASQDIQFNEALEKSMTEKFISSFAMKLEKEDPVLYSGLFPEPRSWVGGKVDPCPPNAKISLGRVFQLHDS